MRDSLGFITLSDTRDISIGSRLAFAAFLTLAAAGCGKSNHPAQKVPRGALGEAMHNGGVSVPLPEGLSGAVPQGHSGPAAPAPYVSIRFDRARPAYEDTLYSALVRALDRYPAAEFDIVLAMPPLAVGGAADEATTRAEARIEEVVLLMSDMGLPAERIRVAARTDMTSAADEIRIYVR